MRFSPTTLQELKMDRFDKTERINFFEFIGKRVNELWSPFVKIMVYTVLNALQDTTHNKYYKPFFSDAENPQETYIGQLNLASIVKKVEEDESALDYREKKMYQSSNRTIKENVLVLHHSSWGK